jgi:hypothetical protein
VGRIPAVRIDVSKLALKIVNQIGANFITAGADAGSNGCNPFTGLLTVLKEHFPEFMGDFIQSSSPSGMDRSDPPSRSVSK